MLDLCTSKTLNGWKELGLPYLAHPNALSKGEQNLEGGRKRLV